MQGVMQAMKCVTVVFQLPWVFVCGILCGLLLEELLGCLVLHSCCRVFVLSAAQPCAEPSQIVCKLSGSQLG